MQALEILVAVGELAYNLVVRRAVHFLAVTRYERDGVALVEQVDDVGTVFLFERKLFGKLLLDFHIILTVIPFETAYLFYNTARKNAIVLARNFQ